MKNSLPAGKQHLANVVGLQSAFEMKKKIGLWIVFQIFKLRRNSNSVKPISLFYLL